MRRPDPQLAAGAYDSFLDIVSNIVGILIILVMVTGLRVKNLPAVSPRDVDVESAAGALEKDQATELALRRDVAEAESQVRSLRHQTMARDQERAELAAAVAAWQQKIDSARNRLDADARAEFDLRRGLAEARSQLDRLDHQHKAAETTRAEPILVESYPTPISTTVDEGEIHFQLKSGRVAFIPLEELLEEFKQDARRKAYKLLDLPEMTDTVGPRGGFRLRYTLKRHDVPIETQLAAGRSGAVARLKRWTLIPVSGELGEPVDAALAEGSRFRRVLAEHRPQKTTVTIWTYSDSFAEFRRLKKELYHLGFPTAARPLPNGTPIGGSPEGTKSAAQ